MANNTQSKPTGRELVELAVRMRRAQRMYFDKRDSSWLMKAKELEREFDGMLERITGEPMVKEADPRQTSLF